MKVILDFVLQVTRALTIGSAPAAIGVDAETVKKPDGTPLIPSSALRGAWRMAACFAADELGMTCCREKHPDRINAAHNVMQRKGARLLEVDVGLGGSHVAEKVCHVCAVFGKPRLQGIVYFTDAEPVEGLAPLLSVRPGVEIDDYTGRVAEGKLYFMEAVEVGSLFAHSIELDVLEARRRGLGAGKAVLLLVEAARYVEPLGLGRGAVRPYLWRVYVEGPGGSQAFNEPGGAAEAVARLDGISGGRLGKLVEAFSAIWLPRVLVLPPGAAASDGP